MIEISIAESIPNPLFLSRRERSGADVERLPCPLDFDLSDPPGLELLQVTVAQTNPRRDEHTASGGLAKRLGPIVLPGNEAGLPQSCGRDDFQLVQTAPKLFPSVPDPIPIAI